MAGIMSCVCAQDTLQATCSLPEHSGTEVLLASMLLLVGMLAWRVERCCVGDSESENQGQKPKSRA